MAHIGKPSPSIQSKATGCCFVLLVGKLVIHQRESGSSSLPRTLHCESRSNHRRSFVGVSICLSGRRMPPPRAPLHATDAQSKSLSHRPPQAIRQARALVLFGRAAAIDLLVARRGGATGPPPAIKAPLKRSQQQMLPQLAACPLQSFSVWARTKSWHSASLGGTTRPPTYCLHRDHRGVECPFEGALLLVVVCCGCCCRPGRGRRARDTLAPRYLAWGQRLPPPQKGICASALEEPSSGPRGHHLWACV